MTPEPGQYLLTLSVKAANVRVVECFVVHRCFGARGWGVTHRRTGISAATYINFVDVDDAIEWAKMLLALHPASWWEEIDTAAAFTAKIGQPEWTAVMAARAAYVAKHDTIGDE